MNVIRIELIIGQDRLQILVLLKELLPILQPFKHKLNWLFWLLRHYVHHEPRNNGVDLGLDIMHLSEGWICIIHKRLRIL